jgi:hypothetical protein
MAKKSTDHEPAATALLNQVADVLLADPLVSRHYSPQFGRELPDHFLLAPVETPAGDQGAFLSTTLNPAALAFHIVNTMSSAFVDELKNSLQLQQYLADQRNLPIANQRHN